MGWGGYRDVLNKTHFVIPSELWYGLLAFRQGDKTFLKGVDSLSIRMNDQNPSKEIGRSDRMVALVAVVIIPDDSVGLMVLQVVVAKALVIGAVGLFVGSVVLVHWRL
ncbi:hypothetical protein Goari_000692 [Gossypium aridum]|uniref:Uncharacterized protein n=1 Tax=Gossypium aridum TaxID=34290 RepID=A0A7J8YJ41_GOSAI|nr:hypothetical protein [Gossypium aridum]